jgi:hypothetical protein
LKRERGPPSERDAGKAVPAGGMISFTRLTPSLCGVSLSVGFTSPWVEQPGGRWRLRR